MTKFTTVGCYDETCIYNRQNVCTRETVVLEVEEGEYENGKRKTYVACQDYKDRRKNNECD